MSQSIVGLIGPGKGPRVTVPSGAASAIIRGLKDDGNVLVTRSDGVSFSVREDIDLDLGENIEWAEFEYNGTSRIICKVRVCALY